MGTVSAGKPIEAIPDPEAIEVPSSFLKRGKHFVLKVYGDSMIDEHIKSGDFVIVQEKVEASNGQTVVALIEYNEVTIKKYFRDENKIELRPANKHMNTMVYTLDKVKIQGVVVGVMRKYNGDFQ